jgi:hypothetical protein
MLRFVIIFFLGNLKFPKGMDPLQFLACSRFPYNLVGTSDRSVGAYRFTVCTVRAIIGSYDDRPLCSHLDRASGTRLSALPASITYL